MKKKQARRGFRLFQPSRYEPCAGAVPAGATIDAYDPAHPNAQRFARWKDGNAAKQLRVVRAEKGDHIGQDLAVIETQTWYAEFRDHQQKIRRLPLFTQRKPSEDAAETLVRVVADVQANKGELQDPKILELVASLPQNLRLKLVEIGLLEPERAGTAKSITEHLADFYKAHASTGVTQKQARLVKHRVAIVIEKCEFRRLCDIRASRVSEALADLRTGQSAVGQRTSNGYWTATNQFFVWLVKDGRMSENPLRASERLTVTDATERRTLSQDEQRWLLHVTEEQPERFGMTGQQRAMAYRAALGTGFRVSELISLKRADFSLDMDPPTIKLAAAAAKNKRAATQPITNELAGRLRDFLRFKAPDAQAFNLPDSTRTARMLRKDLEPARAAWLAQAATAADRQTREQSNFLQADSDEGSVVFHSLRHTYGTMLALAGKPVKLVMDLMRHNDVNLTMKLYSHTLIADRAGALSGLPELQPITTAARQTGTDDVPAAGKEGSSRKSHPDGAAFCLAQNSSLGKTSADSVGRSRRADSSDAHGAETPVNTGETAAFAEENERERSGSIDRREMASSGFLRRRRARR